MGLLEPQFISIEECQETERPYQNKHECYIDKNFEMSENYFPYNNVLKNTYIQLGTELTSKKCQSFINDKRVHSSKPSMFTYPDITIICSTPDTLEQNLDADTNPALIIEILSSNNRNYDKSQKFTRYSDIHMPKECKIKNSESICVNLLTHNSDDTSLFGTLKSLEDYYVINTNKETLFLTDIN